MRCVVVTGLGLVSPIGTGVEKAWRNLIAGQSGIRRIKHFRVEDMASQIAGYIPFAGHDGYDLHGFNPDTVMEPKEQRKVDPFIMFGLGAAQEAITDSGWTPNTEEDRCRTGVLIGSGIGGLQAIHDASIILDQKGPRRLTPFTVPMLLINMTSGHVSIRYGYKGPVHSVVTACATGTHAIGDAARLIQFDDADVMIAGGTEASINRLTMGAFGAARALSTGYNDQPERASQPFNEGRDGFVVAEGAGIVVLEEYEHARARGAHIYAEVVGYGLSGDAYHITAPTEDGDGGYRAMQAAIKRAGIKPSDIDYINAHGTSTPLGDAAECRAIKRLFGESINSVSMSSTKSSIGHLLGAAGAVEAVFSIKTITEGIMPPTLNLKNPSEDCQGIDLVPLTAKKKNVRTVLSNSFGFGGTNASLVFRAV